MLCTSHEEKTTTETSCGYGKYYAKKQEQDDKGEVLVMVSIEEEIKSCLEEELSTGLKLHAASCELVDFHDGIVRLKILGGCSGCPSSQLAIFNSITPILQERFPQIKDVLPA